MESWNDERLDELSGRTDEGFKEMRQGFVRVDREMKEGFARVDREMKEGFARVDREMKEGFAQVPTRQEMNVYFAEMSGRLDRFEDRIERLTHSFMIVGGSFAAAIVAATALT